MRVCFVSASSQPATYSELLAALEDGLQAHGVATLRSLDVFPPVAADLVYVFVPHEYVRGVLPEAYPDPVQLARSVAVTTEQPGTDGFAHAVDVAARCAAAVDVDRAGVRALEEQGVRAVHVPLGYVPMWDRWSGGVAERTVDVLFHGTHTTRRARAISRLGGMLQERRTRLHLVDTVLPPAPGDPSVLSGAAKWDALADARVLLHVHREPGGHLSRQRLVEAVSNGCVVLTEPSAGLEPFTPGDELFVEAVKGMSAALPALLDDPGLLERAGRRAYARLRDELPMEHAVEALLQALEPASAAPAEQMRPGMPAPEPAPRPRELPTPAHLVAERDPLDVLRLGVKQLLVETTALRREVRALRAPIVPSEPVREEYGPYGAVRPQVSVVVTVYNYAEYVGAAIASAGRSRDVAFELVVVDDGSTDGSVDAARRALSAMPEVPSLFVVQPTNGGLAAARNLGVELARAPTVQILDADNELYPRALAAQFAALERHPEAAFAYGIIEMFDVRGPVGLLSWRPWDRLRLQYGNVTDAMALIRRDLVLAAGGYTADPALHGWEDFALWCALAEAGHGGVLVPEVLARYRVGLSSMITVSGIDTTGAWSALLRRHPWLAPERTD